MNYLFPPLPPKTVPILGREELFPVRRIFCVGQNYTAHNLEMGVDTKSPPFFFCKPTDALVVGNAEIAYPPMTSNFQYEVELAVALSEGGHNISPSQALKSILGYAVGFDFTRRDLQAQAKGKGQPWEMSKAFDHSAVISAISPVADVGHIKAVAIWLKVNTELRQNDVTSNMLWDVPEIIANLSAFVALAPGDLIFTGTPAGVSALSQGDLLEGGITSLEPLTVRIV